MSLWRKWIGLGLLGLSGWSGAQELRQGSVFTPEEGKADLPLRAKDYDSQETWEEKAAKIRRGILEGAQLWPLPEKSALNPIRHSAKKRDGYQVENVAIESLPGFFVTGNLYLPDKREKMPLVICPHGHWQGDELKMHGRFREDMHFYGGCNCESGMPIHVRPGHVTNPVEIAAVIVPKPLLVISDGGDWTAHTPEDVLPHLKRIYGFYGQSDQVENAHFPDGKHDYGKEKREALYDFVARKWKLDGARADEALIGFIESEDLLVFDEEDPVPANALKPNQVPNFEMGER